MNRKISSISSILVLAGASLPALAAPTSVTVGLPGAPNAACGDAAMQFLDGFLRKAEPGSHISVFDTQSQRLLAQHTIEPGSEDSRIKKGSRALGPVVAHVRNQNAVREGEANDLHVPAFLAGAIAPSLRSNGQADRLVLIGALTHAEPGDPGMSFGPNERPSPSHLCADSSTSVYGTADRQGMLDGVIVDWIVVQQSGDTPRGQSLQTGFWSSYLDALGGNITTASPSVSTVVDRVIAGASDPVAFTPVDCGVVGAEPLEIVSVTASQRTVRQTPAPVPTAPPEHAPTPAPPPPVVVPPTRPEPAPVKLEPVAHKVDLVLVPDGTSSSDAALSSVRTLGLRIADQVSGLSPELRMGCLIYRDSLQNFSLLPMTTIEPPDAATRPGMDLLVDFTRTPRLEVSTVVGSKGEGTGVVVPFSTRKVPAFSALIAYADVEAAIKCALQQLGSGPSRKVLLFVGDAGIEEIDKNPTDISPADTAAGERLLAALSEYRRANPDLWVIASYAGPEPARASTIDLYEKIAAVAGDRGSMHTGLFGLEEAVRRAVLEQR